jgi:hypothetical protein
MTVISKEVEVAPAEPARSFAMLREPLNKSHAGATMALRDGMRERRRREWYDCGGRSSFFRRKMRRPSGMYAPQFTAAVAAIPSAARPRFAGPSGNAPGRAFARSLTRQTACKAPSHPGCGKIGRDREGRSSLFQRKMRPRSGLLAPYVRWGGPASPLLPDPRFAGPLGLRAGEPWRYAPWHRSPGYDLRRAPYDYPDFTGNALSEDLFRDSLSPHIQIYRLQQLVA